MYKHCTTEKAALQQRRIEEGLLTALREKSYAEITVSSLCEQTNLSRKTFYRLFESKQDVLCSLVDRTIRGYIYFRLPQQASDGETATDLLSFYYYWLEQRQLLTALSENNLVAILFERSIRHVLSEDSDVAVLLGAGQTRETEPLVFYLSGLLTLVMSWHGGGYRKTPEEMAAVTTKLLSKPLLSP